ncbi:hypothetical protein HYPSUDRAFT_1081351 [Hypholoma sublateritium FD-334 SS-4]|uniref:Uncharacterized protein n=1 Tax=Hypholoma sublateritium (strain FD-334 SS-4) TaxID=945553 RepID=A0A0D2KF98_HYPSF|nr:hypothetical protein HYPSUDRAFT_1081351 [Hypholoma sublateritium FD-334 SS-4]
MTLPAHAMPDPDLLIVHRNRCCGVPHRHRKLHDSCARRSSAVQSEPVSTVDTSLPSPTSSHWGIKLLGKLAAIEKVQPPAARSSAGYMLGDTFIRIVAYRAERTIEKKVLSPRRCLIERFTLIFAKLVYLLMCIIYTPRGSRTCRSGAIFILLTTTGKHWWRRSNRAKGEAGGVLRRCAGGRAHFHRLCTVDEEATHASWANFHGSPVKID